MTNHTTAELLRLESGMPGCGCDECQRFYKTLDLSVYGDRVKRMYGVVYIVGRLPTAPKPEDSVEQEPVSKIKDEAVDIPVIIETKKKRGRPAIKVPKLNKRQQKMTLRQLEEKTGISRSTLARRRKNGRAREDYI